MPRKRKAVVAQPDAGHVAGVTGGGSLPASVGKPDPTAAAPVFMARQDAVAAGTERARACSCRHRECPGGKYCLAKLAHLKRAKQVNAAKEYVARGVCVCNVLCRCPKRQRSQVVRCGCGKYFSDKEVRRLGLFSKTEWLKKGYVLLPGDGPPAFVYRSTGFRMPTAWVGLYARFQVRPTRAEAERLEALAILEKWGRGGSSPGKSPVKM